MVAKPKPTKSDRPKNPKVSKPKRKVLEKQIEEMVKRIVFWRDGGQCVERDIDGGRCGGIMNWGHFIPRNKSKYLKYDLATFVQCGAHNMMHDSRKTGGGDPIFGIWFTKTFGIEVLEELSRVQRENQNDKGKHSIPDLEEMLAHYDDLYQNRYTAPVGDLQAMIWAGYYGNVIRDAVEKIKEAR